MFTSPRALSRSTLVSPTGTHTAQTQISQPSIPASTSLSTSRRNRAQTLSRPHASFARLSSDITSATRRMLSGSSPRSGARHSTDVWTPTAFAPLTPHTAPRPMHASPSRSQRTPDSPRKGAHNVTYTHGLVSPISPPTRRLRPSSVHFSRLPVSPFLSVSPPRRNTPGPVKYDTLGYSTPVLDARPAYATPPSSSRAQYTLPDLFNSPVDSLHGQTKVLLDWHEYNAPLISAFHDGPLSSSSSFSFSATESGSDSLFSPTALQFFIAERDVQAEFPTTSPLVRMVQALREEFGAGTTLFSTPAPRVQAAVRVPPPKKVTVMQAPEVQPQTAQVERWPLALHSCANSRGLRRTPAQRLAESGRASTRSPHTVIAPGTSAVQTGAQPSNPTRPDGFLSERASARRFPTRELTQRLDRPRSAPPMPLRPFIEAMSESVVAPKAAPPMRAKSFLSRFTGKAKHSPPPTASLELPPAGPQLMRSNTTGRRGETFPFLSMMRSQVLMSRVIR
ncbi:hypothetical protein BC834DRAFT_892727 [Gloeopeniophorella convolvens]|nr:hypothetical protein BC834DRAFT_892727 [Gloeopeniophorella convolvens]